jgi:hypothetical protein
MLSKDFSPLVQRWREQIEGNVGQGKRIKEDNGGKQPGKHSVESDMLGCSLARLTTMTGGVERSQQMMSSERPIRKPKICQMPSKTPEMSSTSSRRQLSINKVSREHYM